MAALILAAAPLASLSAMAQEATKEAAKESSGDASSDAANQPPPPAGPQDIPASARSLAHLYELMAHQPALTDSDLATYQKFAGDIVALEGDPRRVMDHILTATGWTESRLTYVAVKVGLGLAKMEDPNNPRLLQAPEFALPTEDEALLIASRSSDLAKALRTAAATMPTEPEPEEEAAEAAAE
jgi:hypothetical protein